MRFARPSRTDAGLVGRLAAVGVLAAMVLLASPSPVPAQDEAFTPVPEVGETDLVLGAGDAPVTVFEYSSYLCADCRKFTAEDFWEVYRGLVQPGELRYVIREFPLDDLAFKAAVIARCAAPEKRFGLHVEISLLQHIWGVQKDPMRGLSAIALGHGVARDEFASCLKNKAEVIVVADNLFQGQALLGVSTAPTFFFVMGDYLYRADGRLRYGDFEDIIAALKAASSQ